VTQESWTPSTDKPTGGDSPLIRFRGTLDSFVSEDRTDEQSGRQYRHIVFNFTDISGEDVLEATEPFPFPVAQIRIPYSEPTKSRGATKWEAFAASIRSLAVPLGVGPGEVLQALVGKRQEWARSESTVRVMEEGQWVDAQRSCWKVIEVIGVSGGNSTGMDILAHVADLLDGKNEQEFYQVLYPDEKARQHPEIITQATQRELLPALKAAGLVDVGADGVWHKVAQEA